MSPEQAEGNTDEIGPASDQFSLAVVLYELLTGRTPFQGETLRGLLNSICEVDPEPPNRANPQVTPGLARVCLRALAKRPEDRYPSIAEFAAELARQVGLRLARPRGATSPAQPRRRRSLKRILVLSSAGTTVALAGLAATVIRLGSFSSEDGGPRLPDRPAPREDRPPDRRLAPIEEVLGRARESLYQEDVPHELVLERVGAARERLLEFLESEPRSAAASHLLGRAWEFSGWIDRAEACWRKAIEIAPDLDEARRDPARLLLVRAYLVWCRRDEDPEGRPAEAERLALEAVREIEAAAARGAGPEAELLRFLADATLALVRGDNPSVRRIVALGLERFSGMRGEEELHWILASALPLYREQAASCDRTILLRPKYALALRMRGIVRRELDEYDAAIADLDEAIRLYPPLAEMHNSRGYVRLQKGDFDAAIADFGEAIRLDPNYAYPYANRGVAWRRKGAWDSARADLSRALRLAPKFTIAWQTRGWTYYLHDDFASAIADYDEAIRQAPRNASFRNDRGLVRLDTGDLDQAAEDLEEAIRLDPKHSPAYHNRGRVRQAKGDLAGALSDYGERIRLGPEDPTPYYRRGSLRLEMGDAKGAVADLEKALSIAEENWEYRRMAQEALESAKRGRDGGE